MHIKPSSFSFQLLSFLDSIFDLCSKVFNVLKSTSFRKYLIEALLVCVPSETLHLFPFLSDFTESRSVMINVLIPRKVKKLSKTCEYAPTSTIEIF